MVFRSPPTIIYGKGTVTSVGEQAARFGKKAVLICGKGSLRKSGVLDIIVSSLEKAGVSCAVYDRVGSDPTTSDVDEGAAFAKENGCDVIVAAGGGSPLDAAKGIGMLLTNGGKVTDYEKTAPEKESLPIIAIPTTAGTGSEATRYSVITDTDRNIKMLLSTDGIIPKVAILDFAITKSLPPFMTAATGMDALTHAIEGYTTKAAWEMTDMFHLKAIELISKSLRGAVANTKEGREGMALGQYIAGMGFSNVGLGIAHSMAHTLGAVYDTPHGVACAMMLPIVMEYNQECTGEKYREIARAMGVTGVDEMSQEEYRKAAIDAVKKLSADVGIPSVLEAVKEEDLQFLADSAHADACAPGNPKDASVEDLKDLFRKIMA